MLKRYVLLLISAIFALAGRASEADSMAVRLNRQLWVFPQEKVYVATDCGSYVSGDSIRFRAFLVNAATHQPVADGSRFIYVELINPFGKTDCRVKVRQHDGFFAGVIPLPEELAEGTYTLAAYTLFMQNSGTDTFFRKPLTVHSYLARKYSLSGEIEGNSLRVSLTERRTGRPVRAEDILLTEKDGSDGPSARKRSDFTFHLGKKSRSNGVVRVKFDRYERYFAIPAGEDSLSVTFYPQGGYLIPGRANRLAFTVANTNGLPADASGIITDASGREVARLATEHQGMGVLEFTPAPGQSYRAIIGNGEYPLPPANASATIVTARPIGIDSVEVDMIGSDAGGLALLAHNCGFYTLSTPATALPLRLARTNLGNGVVQLLAVDSLYTVRSSRLLFAYSDSISKGGLSALPQGDYAVSVFADGRAALADTTTSIVASLMLQSELRGQVRQPNYYFENVDSTVAAHMDLLMLTHGWERYDIPATLRGDIAEPQLPMEVGGVILGQARSRWRGKPLAGAKVVAVAPTLGYADAVETDSLGNYAFTGLDWPDGTVFALQVFGNKGNREHNFDIDADLFPDITPLEPEPGAANLRQEPPTASLMADAIVLREVEVTAPRTPEEVRRNMLQAIGIRTVTADQIKEKNYTTYDELVRHIPGLGIVNGNLILYSAALSIYSPKALVELWVDGTRWEVPGSGGGGGGIVPRLDPNLIGGVPAFPLSNGMGTSGSLSEFAMVYPLHMMESVTYYRPANAMVISLTAAQNAGALVTQTKTGAEYDKDSSDVFVHTIAPLGYQNLAEAYQPHYVFDGAGFDEVNRVMMWYPHVTDPSTLNLPASATVIINGLSTTNHPHTLNLKP